jgi:hypothetical protein
MAYFNELPNLEVINRTSNRTSNDETIIVKNLFKRAKLREDINNVVTAFQYYNIEGDERPDQVAQKIYGDPELDWVILIVNNIINVQNDWPISKDSFDNYIMSKYGSLEKLYEVKHYETIELKDSFGRVILPAKLLVDESFYNTPIYEKNDTPPPGITFPDITSPGNVAVATATLDSNGSILNVSLENSGTGYIMSPSISVERAPVTIDASVGIAVSNFSISEISILFGGQGYDSVPTITIDPPFPSVQASAECLLNGNSVGIITNLVQGLGYGNTTPTVTFSSPRSLLSALFLNETFVPIGNGIDGMYVRDDGLKLYSSNGIGTSLIREYDLTSAWNSNTVTFNKDIDVTSDFSYCTGIEFKPDGTRMFVTGGKSGIFKLISYDLSTPWDISSATKLHEVQTSTPGGVRLKTDGTSLFFLHSAAPDRIEEYILSTPWDITTKGPVNKEINIFQITQDSGILGFSFIDDGKVMFVCGAVGSYVYQFNLSTNWDVSTAVLVERFFVGNKLNNPSDVFVRPNKKTLFICGGQEDKLFEYNMFSVAEGFATLTPSGSVNAITVTNAGVGYTEPPTISISSPYPAVGAAATANVTSGVVTSITITNVGFGYTFTPSISIENAPVSIDAKITAVSIKDGSVTSLFVSNPGQNYKSSPQITFDLPGDVTNIQIDDIYTQNERIWKWNGTDWEERITDPFGYLDPIKQEIVRVDGKLISRPVTNYEYEQQINDEKRLIRILKPEYLPVVIGDLREIMTYPEGIEGYISETLRRTYNPKLTGV